MEASVEGLRRTSTKASIYFHLRPWKLMEASMGVNGNFQEFPLNTVEDRHGWTYHGPASLASKTRRGRLKACARMHAAG